MKPCVSWTNIVYCTSFPILSNFNNKKSLKEGQKKYGNMLRTIENVAEDSMMGYLMGEIKAQFIHMEVKVYWRIFFLVNKKSYDLLWYAKKVFKMQTFIKYWSLYNTLFIFFAGHSRPFANIFGWDTHIGDPFWRDRWPGILLSKNVKKFNLANARVHIFGAIIFQQQQKNP